MAVPLFLLAAGAKAFSAIWQGRIADAQGKAEKRLFDRNALVLERDADARERKARFDQLRSVEAGERAVGRLRAGLGASGARLDVGAPIAVLAEQAAESDLETALIGEEGAVEAARFREQAVISRFKGSLARTRGKQAKKTSLIKAGTSLLTDFATGKAEGLI